MSATPVGFTRRALGPAGVVIAAGTTIVFASGTAFAFFSGGHGTGSGSAGTGPLPTITATAGTTTGLYPGGKADLTLSINNPYGQSLQITGITAGTGPVSVSAPGVGACNTTGVSLATPSGISPSTLLAGTGSTVITLSNAVSMDGTSDSGCQAATFSVPVKLTVKVG